MSKLNRRYAALIALAAAWGCTPDDYPTAARSDPPPIEIILPDGELFIYRPPAGAPEITSMAVAFVDGPDTTFTPMLEFADGRWVVGIGNLEPGVHQYKYVFNGDTWATNMCNDPVWGDPANGGRVDSTVVACADDGSGNAVRIVPVDELPAGELFFYIPPAGVTVTSVAVPGEFNGWNPSAPEAQMQLLADGRWLLAIEGLDPGPYNYKYHFNGTTWAGNMCGDETWGHPAHGDTVDLDLDECVGQDARRIVGESEPTGHTFRYIVPPGVDVDRVNLAGNMITPNWSPGETPMAQIWTLTVAVEPGEYMYKYVFNGNQWASNMCNDPTWGDAANGGDVDPDIDECNPDDNFNGVLVVEEAGTHTFRYIVPANVDPTTIESVSVAGNFMDPNWDPSAGPMQETYSVTLDLSALEPGEYMYKYVFNGDQWADNMCNSATWGHPDFDNKVDPDVVACNPNDNNNAILTID